jgi:GT2 family glycosyltransferase
MLIGSRVLQDVSRLRGSYLDDKFFLYGEDVEFCQFARRIGYRTVLANRAVIHHEAASSSGGQFNPVAYYYVSRNRVFLASRNLAMAWRGFFHAVNGVVCSARILKNLAVGRPRAALAIFRGVLDAYRGIGGKWRYHDREAQKTRGH